MVSLSLGKMGKTRRIGKFLSYSNEHYGLRVTRFRMKTVQQFSKKLFFTAILYFFFHKLANDILNMVYIFPLKILIILEH